MDATVVPGSGMELFFLNYVSVKLMDDNQFVAMLKRAPGNGFHLLAIVSSTAMLDEDSCPSHAYWEYGKTDASTNLH